MDIIDNFLTPEEFEALRAIVTSINFPWHFSENYVNDYEKNREDESPGVMFHSVYYDQQPRSPFYETFLPITETLNAIVLYRIRLNLTFRLCTPTPYVTDWHGDMQTATTLAQQSQWTTSILYMGTNNGRTEFKDGQRVESVANRLLSFPADTKHRVVTQTDELIRIVVNFNYLKVDTAHWGTVMDNYNTHI